MENLTEADVRCPFFLSMSKRGICCEGVAEETKTILRFSSQAEKENYLQRHCCKMPWQTGCGHCGALMECYKARGQIV